MPLQHHASSTPLPLHNHEDIASAMAANSTSADDLGDSLHGTTNSANCSAVEMELENCDIASSGVVIEAAVAHRPTIAPSKHLNRLAVFCFLAVTSYFGVIVRILVIRCFTFLQSSSPIYAVAYANFLGCFIFGLLTDHKVALATCFAPLAIAMLTGLCGSITSLSSVMVSSAGVIFGHMDCNLTAYQRIIIFVQNYFFNFFISFALFFYGRHLSHQPCIERTARQMLSMANNNVNIGDQRSILYSALVMLIYTLLSIFFFLTAIVIPNSREFCVAMLLGQVGVTARYYLGKYLNPRFPFFPLGTLLANIIGSAVASVVAAYSVYMGNKVDGSTTMFLATVANGFCGALSTVSTFIGEVSLLPDLRKALCYITATLALSQAVVVLPYIIFQFSLPEAQPISC